MTPRLLRLLYQRPVRRAAYHSLVERNRDRHDLSKGRFTRREVDDFLEAVWARYEKLARDLPHLPSPGARHNLALACLTYAACEVLTEKGIERAYAVELFGDVVYHIYIRWGSIARTLARVFKRDPAARMRLACNLFLTFPFDQPGYRYERRDLPDGLAFNITYCPVAEFFRAHEAGDVCLNTWCHQDWALAEHWGGWMERTQTQAEGAAFCDFKWRAKSAPS